MKKCNLIISFLICSILIIPSFASETEVEYYETETYSETETLYFEESSEAVQTVPETYDFQHDLSELINQFPDENFSNISDISIKAVNPITPSSTSGLKSALISVLGNYDAIVVEYAYQSTNGYTSYLREVQPDYVWLCACAILLITIYSLFKFIGGLFSGKR